MKRSRVSKRESLNLKLRRKRGRRNLTPYAFLAGALLFMLATAVYPFADTIRLAFYQANLARPDLGSGFIGLENFRTVLGSSSFWVVLLRTVIWTVLSVSAKVCIGLLLAFLLYQPFRGRRIYQTLLFVPWVTPFVVAAVSWKYVYDSEIGILNYALVQFGLLSEPHTWLGGQVSAFLSVAAVDVWVGVPLMTILLIAGLQAIPTDTLEAAKIDGARLWAQTRYITLPQLRPVIAITTLLSLIWTFNSFPVIWSMTRGGPSGATETLVIKTYQEFFGSFNVGIGATYAVVAMLILLCISAVYMKLLGVGEER